MSYYLFLDDLRVPAQVKWVDLPPRDWTIVRSYDEFVSAIEKRGLPEYVTFDHDLGMDAMLAANGGIEYAGPEKTGMDCARYLVNYCLDHSLLLPQWSIHSINPIGKENIASYLLSAERAISS